MRVYLMLLLSIILFPQIVNAREPSENEKEQIITAVKNKLVDPYSAKFKWVEYVGGEPKSNDVLPYCGIVNSKNRYGGYVGDMPYVVVLKWRNSSLISVIIVFFGDGDPNSLNTKSIYIVCADHGYNKLYLAK